MSQIGLAPIVPPRSVFVDEGVFSPTYQVLHGRTAELWKLATYFRSLVTAPGLRSSTVILRGPLGTGKSLVMRTFCDELVRYSSTQRIPSDPRLMYFIVDRYLRTPYAILTSLLQTLLPAHPRKGFQVAELLGLLHQVLREQNLILLLCLPEIDYFPLSARHDFLYALSRTEEVLLPTVPRAGTSRINLLLLTQDPDFLDTLDEATRGSLGNNVVYFPPYSKKQLVGILTKRARQGLHPKAYILPTFRAREVL